MSTSDTVSNTQSLIYNDKETANQKKSDQRSVKVNILGKELHMGCAAKDEANLKKAVQYVNTTMTTSRARHKTLSIEKLAIVTAINIADDLLKQGAEPHEQSVLTKELQLLSSKIDSALAENDTNS